MLTKAKNVNFTDEKKKGYDPRQANKEEERKWSNAADKQSKKKESSMNL